MVEDWEKCQENMLNQWCDLMMADRWESLWKQDAVSFISDFEWFRECSYNDSKQVSIGYGTKAKYNGECITEQEAKQRKLYHLQPLIELVDNSCYNDNQRIALVSYMYNVWVNALNIKHYVEKCDHKSILYIFHNYWWTINGVWSDWLAKRRNIEISKYNS